MGYDFVKHLCEKFQTLNIIFSGHTVGDINTVGTLEKISENSVGGWAGSADKALQTKFIYSWLTLIY